MARVEEDVSPTERRIVLATVSVPKEPVLLQLPAPVAGTPLCTCVDVGYATMLTHLVVRMPALQASLKSLT